MVGITQDSTSGKLVLTATVTIYLDRTLTSVLDEEVSKAIREQAIKDLQSNPAIKKQVQKAASEFLIQMLQEKLQPKTFIQPGKVYEAPTPAAVCQPLPVKEAILAVINQPKKENPEAELAKIEQEEMLGTSVTAFQIQQLKEKK
jgi:hypothetical protein